MVSAISHSLPPFTVMRKMAKNKSEEKMREI